MVDTPARTQYLVVASGARPNPWGLASLIGNPVPSFQGRNPELPRSGDRERTGAKTLPTKGNSKGWWEVHSSRSGRLEAGPCPRVRRPAAAAFRVYTPARHKSVGLSWEEQAAIASARGLLWFALALIDCCVSAHVGPRPGESETHESRNHLGVRNATPARAHPV